MVRANVPRSPLLRVNICMLTNRTSAVRGVLILWWLIAIVWSGSTPVDRTFQRDNMVFASASAMLDMLLRNVSLAPSLISVGRRRKCNDWARFLC